jgi:hypothetical protein
MSGLSTVVHLENEGGRRSGHDRRGFLPRRCILEKRAGQDRRMGLDRRIGKEDFVNIFEPKRNTDGSVEFLRSVRGLFEGICICLLLWGAIIIFIDFIFGRIILTSIGSPQ